MKAEVHRHEFNSDWWGEPVGIIRSGKFFSATAEERNTALAPFAWAEFKAPLDDSELDHDLMARAGFYLADCQVNYRLRMPCAMRPASLDRLDVAFADEAPFAIEAPAMQPFAHERYHRLPGDGTMRAPTPARRLR